MKIADILARNKNRTGPLLPVLHDIQAEFGCIDEEAVREVATALNLTRAEVHGVISFYHDFLPSSDPRPEIQICRAEACKARGIEALVPSAEAVAGDRVRLTSVYCLGLCGAGPAARAGDRLYARLDKERLCQIVERS